MSVTFSKHCKSYILKADWCKWKRCWQYVNRLNKLCFFVARLGKQPYMQNSGNRKIPWNEFVACCWFYILLAQWKGNRSTYLNVHTEYSLQSIVDACRNTVPGSKSVARNCQLVSFCLVNYLEIWNLLWENQDSQDSPGNSNTEVIILKLYLKSWFHWLSSF